MLDLNCFNHLNTFTKYRDFILNQFHFFNFCNIIMLYFYRNGRGGTLEIDDVAQDRGESGGNLKMLNVQGNIYIGEKIYMSLTVLNEGWT